MKLLQLPVKILLVLVWSLFASDAVRSQSGNMSDITLPNPESVVTDPTQGDISDVQGDGDQGNGQPTTEEPAAAAEEPVAEDPADAAEEPVAEDPAAAEEPVAEDPAAAEEPVAEDPAAAEEPVAEDSAAPEEPAAEDSAVTPTEESPGETPLEAIIEENTTPETSTDGEEPVAGEPDAPTDGEEPVAEEPDAPADGEEPVAGEPDAPTDDGEEPVAEEPDAPADDGEEPVAGEPDAPADDGEEPVAGEPDAPADSEATASETPVETIVGETSAIDSSAPEEVTTSEIDVTQEAGNTDSTEGAVDQVEQSDVISEDNVNTTSESDNNDVTTDIETESVEAPESPTNQGESEVVEAPESPTNQGESEVVEAPESPTNQGESEVVEAPESPTNQGESEVVETELQSSETEQATTSDSEVDETSVESDNISEEAEANTDTIGNRNREAIAEEETGAIAEEEPADTIVEEETNTIEADKEAMEGAEALAEEEAAAEETEAIAEEEVTEEEAEAIAEEEAEEQSTEAAVGQLDRVAYEAQFQEAAPDVAIQMQEEFQLNELVGSSGLEIYGNVPSVKDISARLSELAEQTGKKPAFINVSLQSNQLESFVVLPDGSKTAAAKSATVASTDLNGINAPGLKDLTVRKTVKDTSRKDLIATAGQFREEVSNARNIKRTDYLQSSQELYKVLIEPIAAELEANDIDILVFSLDSGLRLLPLAALHDGEQFLVEKYAMATVPSFGLTDTRYVNLKDSPILAMGASEFTEQNSLPAMPLELETILRNPRQGEAFLNEQFTISNFRAQNSRETPFPIIHLGTHAEFKAGNVGDSYIQFYDDKLKIPQLQEISNELGWNSDATPVELLVLSACVTAFGDAESELGFAGLAVQAGAKSALASLWNVSDLGTLALMGEFYDQLGDTLIKAEALRQTQLQMLKGNVMIDDGTVNLSNGENLNLPAEFPSGTLSLNHPYFWSSFTLIGNWN